MTVELRDLKWAIAVSHHRSLRQAAEFLNVRQSTLSRGLRDLEDRLGVRLFERTNGGTRPTLVGNEFLRTARRIVHEAEVLSTQIKTRSRGEAGQLTIGVHASFSAGNLRATLNEYLYRFPDVETHVADGSSNQLRADLASSSIDIAFIASELPDWESKSLSVWSERVILAVSQRHRLADRTSVDWVDISKERVLLPLNGPGPELEQLLRARIRDNRSVRILRQNSGLDRLLSLVNGNVGVLVMLEGGTGIRCEGITYREINGRGEATRLNFVAYWQQSNNNPTLARFLDILRERYPDISVKPSTA